jgi:hypothetical protein
MNRKQIEAAIELARLTADQRDQSTRLLRLLADQLERMIMLFDKSAKVAIEGAREARARELSNVLGLLDVEEETTHSVDSGDVLGVAVVRGVPTP